MKPIRHPILEVIYFGAVITGVLVVVPNTRAQDSATSISFQGALNGPNNVPLADATNYALHFRFYGNALGGVALGTTTVTGVAVAGGVASTVIRIQPSWFNGSTRYLGVGVSSNGAVLAGELSPRVLVTAVPYAAKASTLGDSLRQIAPNQERNAFTIPSGLEVSGSGYGEFAYSGGYREGVFQNWQGTGNNADCFRLAGTGRSAGFGCAIGPSIVSPVIWMNEFAGNALEVRRVTDLGEVPEGVVLFRVRSDGIVDVPGTIRTTILQITSDRNAKEGFESVDCRDVLAKLAGLPITTWAYTNAPSKRHLGPIAQDFAAAFGLGEGDKHIATVDADGVALAAIQGLYQFVTTHQSDLRSRESEIHALQERLENLERIVAGHSTPDQEEGK